MNASSPMAPSKSNVKRQKDDKDYYKARLADATFNPSEDNTVHRICFGSVGT